VRRGHRRGVATVDGDDAFGVVADGIGVFPPGNPRCWLTGAPWLGVRASRRPGHPGECGAVRSVGCWEGNVRRRKMIRLAGGARLS
jgi:hypothetical protein